MLLRGIVIWMLWIERNEAVYDGVFWSPEDLRSKIWLGAIDYGRIAWQKLVGRCKKTPDKSSRLKSSSKLNGVLAESSPSGSVIDPGGSSRAPV
jgi:hypothetical protein